MIQSSKNLGDQFDMVEDRDSWVAFLNELKAQGMDVTREGLNLDNLPAGDVRGTAAALHFWVTRPESQTVQKDAALYYGMCLVELAGACHAAGQSPEGNMPLLNEAVRVLYIAADFIQAKAEASLPVYTLDVLMEGRKLAAVGNHVVRFARHYKMLRLETQGLHIQLNGVWSSTAVPLPGKMTSRTKSLKSAQIAS